MSELVEELRRACALATAASQPCAKAAFLARRSCMVECAFPISRAASRLFPLIASRRRKAWF